MKRRDFEVRNQRGLKLVCSQWRPAFTEDTSKLPCVVYLHGNSSARIDVIKTGAAAALLYAGRYPDSDLCGLILDSPFCSFRHLAKDLLTDGQARQWYSGCM
ncbi:unnamed protein product [Ectocarpus fasciculatus]